MTFCCNSHLNAAGVPGFNPLNTRAESAHAAQAAHGWLCVTQF